MNSAFVEILGGEAAFEQYDGSEEGTEGRLPGSQVSNADTTKFTESVSYTHLRAHET